MLISTDRDRSVRQLLYRLADLAVERLHGVGAAEHLTTLNGEFNDAITGPGGRSPTAGKS